MGVAALAVFASGPGQSYLFAVFIDPILRETGLSRTYVSTLYALGTGASALMVVLVGRLVDRYGARAMLAAIALAFGGACFGMAAAAGPLALLLGFAALRALGQGSLSVTATLLTAQWFVRYRGRAMSLVGLGAAAGNAALPPLVAALIAAVGWRDAYRALGLGVWLALIPAALLIVRNRPEAIGLHPDGAAEPPAREGPAISPGEELGGPRARAVWRSARFWLLALPLTAGPFLGTALIFHQVALFAERGLDAGVAATAFVPLAAASALATAVAGYLVDRLGPSWLVLVHLGLLLAAMLGLQVIATPAHAVVYAATLGAATGMLSVISGVTWAHHYGRQGLGRVQGLASMVTISAAAVGPLPVAALQQVFGSYRPVLLLLLALPVLCALLVPLGQRHTAEEPVAGGR